MKSINQKYRSSVRGSTATDPFFLLVKVEKKTGANQRESPVHSHPGTENGGLAGDNIYHRQQPHKYSAPTYAEKADANLPTESTNFISSEE